MESWSGRTAGQRYLNMKPSVWQTSLKIHSWSTKHISCQSYFSRSWSGQRGGFKPNATSAREWKISQTMVPGWGHQPWAPSYIDCARNLGQERCSACQRGLESSCLSQALSLCPLTCPGQQKQENCQGQSHIFRVQALLQLISGSPQGTLPGNPSNLQKRIGMVQN